MRFTAAFAALAASMAGMAQAQIARTSGMTADSFCSEVSVYGAEERGHGGSAIGDGGAVPDREEQRREEAAEVQRCLRSTHRAGK